MIRVIAHVDMDCFYCQVEHKRLGIPPTTPLAVQQWNMMIAVNYAARPFGIKRGMKAEECRKRCPGIQLVHVEVLDNNNSTSSASLFAAEAAGESSSSSSSSSSSTSSKSSSRPNTYGKTRQWGDVSKASLERYRRASEEIMAVFSRYIPLCERASIDEAYFDLTDIAEQREHKNDIDFDAIDTDAILNTIPPYKLSIESSRLERRYAVGAVIVSEIRAAVFQELGFTVSAGVAGNKMIAKQASAAFKPNRQTVVPPAASLSMISRLRIKDVRGLGGKFGYEVKDKLKVETLGDIRERYTRQDLSTLLGTKYGYWLHDICFGKDEEPVKSNLVPKSLLAFKSFETVDTVEVVEKWLELLCTDVLNRMKGDMLTNHRRPKGLMVWHRATNLPGSRRFSDDEYTRSGPMPLPPLPNNVKQLLADSSAGSEMQMPADRSAIINSSLPTLADLMKAAMNLLSRVPGTIAPCCRLGVGASDFMDIPQLKPNSASGAGIDSFFKKKEPSLPSSSS
jgi:DNA polymerase eta